MLDSTKAQFIQQMARDEGKDGPRQNTGFEEILSLAHKTFSKDGNRANIIVKAGKNAKWYLKLSANRHWTFNRHADVEIRLAQQCGLLNGTKQNKLIKYKSHNKFIFFNETN